MISYKPFFLLLEERKISQYMLESQYGVSKGLMDSLRSNRNLTLNSIEDLCKLLKCEPKDIFEFVDEPETNS